MGLAGGGGSGSGSSVEVLDGEWEEAGTVAAAVEVDGAIGGAAGNVAEGDVDALPGEVGEGDVVVGEDHHSERRE